ncbi:diphosphate--fructose-6-phosphate 1-phosphotransferase [Thermotoga neapolitana]|uniref:Pyrophosphate--fructose 6-phosphate 1-phosphotransferase n=1 Tax=Thermotoga neapolitana (strain ATCC 49049 / DSM 4359 / NBRC 107923 / NS-E) TaxID=309803 RepID=B9KC25_THENN|nr:diphosphate--fructose-6-phosphate 1-phosphotransferase [Thermotoga neapolitana]ACM22571.1 6-phosphofructokinase, pyrophosphate-dependent [Thermotoga neapolitana DSM 4359]KFZ22215.1 6-phosphofructokinase, pyrophosphate-dependent [Thermotoga neapolitana LA10]
MAEKLGILVGGGPAPGINSVISAVTIEAINNGLEVIGIYDGFKHLVEGKTNMVKKLTIEDVSRIHIEGGSILRTSRVNPAKSEETLEKTIQALKKLGIKYLVTIGGDDTAFSASKVSERSRGEIKVVHVPKTIDNDLPLPENMPTFGFETARHVATELVYNLMQDSRTTDRWYFVAMMGREAGHLALGVGKAASATITIIPEEFREGVTLEEVCDVLDGAILKRKLMGRNDGVAVIGEGIAEKMDPEELANIPGVIVEKDPHGHLRLAEIPLATILKRAIEKRFAERGEKIHIVDVTIGYELRSARPIPFDIVYTRTLGYGAVRFLLGDYSDLPGGMVCVVGGRIKILPFDAFMDPKTGRTRVRLVDVRSEDYRVARKYMIRLEKKDLEDPETLEKLAKLAKMEPEEFKKKYWHTTELP